MPLILVLSACGGSGNAATPESSSGGGAPAAGSNIELIVPSAAGGGNDILARIVAPVLSEKLDANVEVINKEGGGQIIGLSYLAEADPDGLTMGYTNIPSILGRYLDPSKNAKFDRSSFAPVGSFASNTVGIFVRADSPYTTFQQLLDAVKAAPDTVTTATDSRAGDDHVNLLRLQDALGATFNIVHYDSGADKVAALVSGEVEFAIGGISSFNGQVKAGDLKALAVVADQETSFLPGVPTVKSLGFDVPDMTSRFALSVPAGTPAGTVAALEAALKATADDPAVQTKLKDAATEPAFLPAADVSALWAERETETRPIIESLLAGS